MAIFSDGFETGNFNNWTGTNGAPSVQGVVVHHGSWAALMDADNESCYKDLDAIGEAFFRFYFRYTVNPAIGETYEIADIAQEVWTHLLRVLIVNDDGTIKWRIEVRKGDATYQTFTADTPNPTINTWYCVELWFKKNTVDGAKLYVNSVNVLTATGITTYDENIACVVLRYFTSAASTPNQYFDCTVVDSSRINCEAEEEAKILRRLLVGVGL